MEITTVYSVDGKTFNSKNEAEAYARRPQIITALKDVAGNDDTSEWLYEHMSDILAAFKAGSAKKTSAEDREALEQALAVVNESSLEGVEFLCDNAASILASFRFVNSGTPTTRIKDALNKVAGDDEELVDWIYSNKESLVKAFDAGRKKQPMHPAALEGLKRHREEQARLKAEAEELSLAKAAEA